MYHRIDHKIDYVNKLQMVILEELAYGLNHMTLIRYVLNFKFIIKIQEAFHILIINRH